MVESRESRSNRRFRHVLATTLAAVGTVVWTHALAGAVRAAVSIPAEALAPASAGLTLVALAAALVAGACYAAPGRAATASALTAVAGSALVGWLHPAALIPALVSVPVAAAFAAFGAALARRLPESLERLPARRPALTAVWVIVALVGVVQVARLATYVTDPETDWFLSTRHPFYAKHECANAYFYGAELNRRAEPNVYDAAHYPGLSRDAEPSTELRGMSPEDPFQYAPQFLLWPRLAIALTSDYAAIRAVWFGVNVTLCMTAVLLLAAWVGGRAGTAAGLLAPVVLASFPVLHNFQYGQFHFAAVALAVLALLAFRQGRAAVGGALLAVSILSKLFPALLLFYLAARRRWRDLAWTAGGGLALTALALAVIGPAPFLAFFDYHLPRLADGRAFAFDEAWPEVADLITAGNQGVHGVVGKLGAMGVPGAGAGLARVAGWTFLLVLLASSVAAGMRAERTGRSGQVVLWLALLGLGSLSSTGAWADYVPLTCVWLLTWLVPRVDGRRGLQIALGTCALLQFSLLGTMPLGPWQGQGWMLPLSLAGALAMFAVFFWALARVLRSDGAALGAA